MEIRLKIKEEQTLIKIVRYFVFEENEYLIFTKGEIDDKDYEKIYLTKIENEEGNRITSEEEMNKVLNEMKEMIKKLQTGELEEIPFSLSALLNINILGENTLKISKKFVDILTEKEVESFSETFPFSQTVEEGQEKIDYRVLYQMELENRRAIQRELEEVKKQFASYKEKVEKIQEIMD